MLIDSTWDAEPEKGKQRARERHRWHAVMLLPGADACAAVQTCKGRRYLSKEAPRLPLEGCDAKSCECRYRHYADRRGPPRRREEAGEAIGTAPERTRPETNRRTRPGRRLKDV
jgi:hypothetical protein